MTVSQIAFIYGKGNLTSQQIKVGEIYPGGCPAEGLVAQIRGGSFNVTLPNDLDHHPDHTEERN